MVRGPWTVCHFASMDVVPVAAVEDPVSQRIDGIAGVEDVLDEPRTHDEAPAQAEGEQGTEAAAPPAIRDREQAEAG